MTRLSTFLSDDDRRDYALSALAPGHVLYLHVEFTRPPKDKYLVILCRGSRPLLFLINSRIPALSQTTAELRACQVRLTPTQNDFLDHESYLDCSDLIDGMRESDIVAQLIADPSRVCGKLTDETKRQLISIVRRARTLSKFHKDKILAALLD